MSWFTAKKWRKGNICLVGERWGRGTVYILNNHYKRQPHLWKMSLCCTRDNGGEKERRRAWKDHYDASEPLYRVKYDKNAQAAVSSHIFLKPISKHVATHRRICMGVIPLRLQIYPSCQSISSMDTHVYNNNNHRIGYMFHYQKLLDCVKEKWLCLYFDYCNDNDYWIPFVLHTTYEDGQEVSCHSTCFYSTLVCMSLRPLFLWWSIDSQTIHRGRCDCDGDYVDRFLSQNHSLVDDF